MIKVIPYNPNWPVMFAHEVGHIEKALDKNCVTIHHIGSTAVPGLVAKPVIDIIAVVKDMSFSWEPLEEADYIGRGEINIPLKLYFKKQTNDLPVHLHIYEEGNPEIELNLKFRDHLRNHPDDSGFYAKLKLDLATNQDLHIKGDKRFSGYNLGKDKFIKNILQKAGFQRNCMRFCAHDDEWAAARKFRQKYFFDQTNIQDSYTWTFNHPDHVHFVFYQGVEIVGYSHIEQRLQNSIMRIIVIDEVARRRGLGSSFLKLIERWLKQKQFQTVHIEASPEAYEFYLKQGYQEIISILNDHERSVEDTSIGKIL